MRFKKMRLALSRKRLEKNDFYEEITFEDKVVSKNVKKIVAEWMFLLEEYKKIRIERFKELFSELHEIVFPIKIKKSYYSSGSFDIIIVDNESKEYYMSKRSIYYYNDI